MGASAVAVETLNMTRQQMHDINLPISALPLLDLLLPYLIRDANRMRDLLQLLNKHKQPLDYEAWNNTRQGFTAQYRTVRIILDILTQWRDVAKGTSQLQDVERLTSTAFEMQDLTDQVLALNNCLGFSDSAVSQDQ